MKLWLAQEHGTVVKRTPKDDGRDISVEVFLRRDWNGREIS